MSHISTTTGSTQSTNHTDVSWVQTSASMGCDSSVYEDVSLTSGQLMHQELQNTLHYLLPLIKVLLILRQALSCVKHFVPH